MRQCLCGACQCGEEQGCTVWCSELAAQVVGQMLRSEWTHTEKHRTPPLDLSVVRKQKATEKRRFIWLHWVLWMQLFSSCFTTIRHNSFHITHFKPVSPGIKYQVFPMSCSSLDHPVTHKHCFGLHGYSGDSGIFLPHHWLPRIHVIK